MLREIVAPVFDLFCMRVVVVSVFAMGVASIFVESERRRNFYSVKVENYFGGRSAGFMLR